jgi:hypothetical protein
MKFLLPLGLLLLIILSGGCKKDGSLNGQLYGDWKLTSYFGGITGRVSSPGPDSVCVLSLQGDHNYKKTVNGNLSESGTYSVGNVESVYTNELAPAVTFKDTNTGGPSYYPYTFSQLIELHKDTLYLTINGIDGGGFEYIRVRGGGSPSNTN